MNIDEIRGENGGDWDITHNHLRKDQSPLTHTPSMSSIVSIRSPVGGVIPLVFQRMERSGVGAMETMGSWVRLFITPLRYPSMFLLSFVSIFIM